jgi:hypothetical protein
MVITRAITGRTKLSIEHVEQIGQLYPMQEHQETLPWFKPPFTLTAEATVRYQARSCEICGGQNGTGGGGGVLPRLLLFLPVKLIPTIPVDAQSKAWVCGRSLDGIADSKPAESMDVSCDCDVLSGRGRCVGLTTSPEEAYRVWCVWVWSRNLNDEEALTHKGCRAMEKILPH